jgi:hypothetical protein
MMIKPCRQNTSVIFWQSEACHGGYQWLYQEGDGQSGEEAQIVRGRVLPLH